MAKLTRKCYRCKKTLPLSLFPSHASKPLGKGYRCKKCCTKAQQLLYTPDQRKAMNRKQRLKTKYSMTLEDHKLMHTLQGGLCLICQQKKELVVDHDHVSGRVRGLLCRTCNSGLGMFKEDILIFKRAMEYVSLQNSL